MKNFFKTLSFFAIILIMVGVASCSKDEPGSGGGSIDGSNTGKISYAFFIEGGSSGSLGIGVSGKIYNTILFSNLDITDSKNWNDKTVLTTYTLDLISEEDYSADNIPTGEFIVGEDCRFYFAINQRYDSEGEIEGGMMEDSVVKISKKGNKYTFDISGIAGYYEEGESLNDIKYEPMTFHYEGEVIETGLSDDDF